MNSYEIKIRFYYESVIKFIAEHDTKKLIIVNKITKNANGKIDRKYLAKNYYDRKKLIKI